MKITFKSIKSHLGAGFEEILTKDWQDWTWQLRQSLKKADDFSKILKLSSDEMEAFEQGQEVFNIRSTPYYIALVNKFDSADPIRKILLPHRDELSMGSQQMLDPLNERKNNPAPRVIHRYPDRALFLVTDICSVYCRYCTRKHFTGQDQAFIRQNEYEAALTYFKNTPKIREVILSGGDPLTLSDGQLERVLTDLRKIEHIEIIRIGTRIPVVCPMRITPQLVEILKAAKPVFMMTHFNHPRELTLEAKESLELMVDNGVPLFNQMVLLNGVNNHPAIVQALSRRLLYCRVKPYYMFQCDPSVGTDHLRTTVAESAAIQKELWGTLSGLAMPNLSLDIPAGGGKVGIVPNFLVSPRNHGFTEVWNENHEFGFKGWDGVEATYVDPQGPRWVPSDVSEYLEEWQLLKS